MKVLLIASNFATTPIPVYPLGISIIANALNNNNIDVFQFDFLQSNKSLDKLLDVIKSYSPDVIGISIRNIDTTDSTNQISFIDIVKEMTQKIKEKYDTPIVLGGSAFSILPNEIMKVTKADYGMLGEGEILFPKFVENIEKGIFPKDKIISSENHIKGEDIVSASYDKDILNFYLKEGNIASVQTKRGCNHKCIYCSYPFLEGNVIRSRNPIEVVDDIVKLSEEFGAELIFLTDSIFNDTEKSYMKILENMDKRNVSVPWTAFFRPDNLTNDEIALMKHTGLCAAEIGADATTDITLKKLGKTFNFQDVLDINKLFIQNEISPVNYFMFGCPGETKDTVIEGIKNINSIEKAASFIFMGIRILPYTPLFTIAKKEGFVNKKTDLLKPVFYISKEVEKDWLNETLTEGFKHKTQTIYPPTALESSLKFMHKLGYSGMLYDKLISKK